MNAFLEQLKPYQQNVNKVLQNALQTYPESRLREAMEYALLLGGKRVRPFLVYAVGEMLGLDGKVLDKVAASIECIHAYSLIHDDLPAMDDDKLRRGNPTCHLKFDEATAILAGDALQSLAFSLLADCTHFSSLQQIALIQVLAKEAGAKGMCLGQMLDLEGEDKALSLQALERIHQLKTGALLVASVQLGQLSSPYWQDKQIQIALTDFARFIGLAFQVQDDILDIEGNEKTLGKAVGADALLQKSTYPKLLGLAKAKAKAQSLCQQALNALAPLDTQFNTQPLRQFAAFVVSRHS